MLYPSNVDIESKDFGKAWAKLVSKIMQVGMVLPTEYGNMSRDVCSRVTLTGNAIVQIQDIELHPQEMFGVERTKIYMEQFKREYDYKAQGFEYTYMERLMNHSGVDQFKDMGYSLLKGITRRAQMITWIPNIDGQNEHPPCLQRIWIRPLSEGTCEVHLSWRSRDAYGAWPSNLCAVMKMLDHELLMPLELEVVKIVDCCDSAHVYDTDWDAANKVRPLYK